MPIITKDQSQDKASNKLDKSLHKKTKRKPLREETWGDLSQRGASLAEQFLQQGNPNANTNQR